MSSSAPTLMPTLETTIASAAEFFKSVGTSGS